MRTKKIFIVGNSRSGTTMLGRILGNHNEIFTFHEIHFFEQLIADSELNVPVSYANGVKIFSNLISIQRKGYLNHRENNLFENESKNQLSILYNKLNNNVTPMDIYDYYLHYECARNGKNIPCEQTPRNLFYLNEIVEKFPDAFIINMIRDPRSVILSQKNKWKRRTLGANNIPLFESLRSWANYHPITISNLWKSSINNGKSYYNNKSIKLIFFEDLIKYPNKTIDKIIEFLKIKNQSKLSEIPQIGSSQLKDNPKQKGIRKEIVSSWKNGGLTNEEIYICQSINYKLLYEFNYKIEEINVSYIRLVLICFNFPIKILLSLILNLHRYKNIYSAIKRRFYDRAN